MKSNGFTLIELMVVVAIIALLTSVVAALIGDGRDKAQAQAFRSEIDQLIKAVELYRADTGRLPGQTSGISTYVLNQAGAVEEASSNFDLADILTDSATPYIQGIPKPPFTGYMALVVNPSGARCEGSDTSPEYLVWVMGERNIEDFMDWPALIPTAAEAPNNDIRCFSINNLHSQELILHRIFVNRT